VQGWLGSELHDGGHADPQLFHSWFTGHWAIVMPAYVCNVSRIITESITILELWLEIKFLYV